uniref:Uncharacterized protein n=1 Tax=Siphoviridae sp. ctdLA8 TaxID=2826398 RepID=A0A8S5NAW5_9CAUD|nr:MAG TPA: hypothetical protein [Siphoviridae sp. ctdLA8]DAG66666.1 MAG TPA: hypothetical protein [Caudoviricetes sp.]
MRNSRKSFRTPTIVGVADFFCLKIIGATGKRREALRFYTTVVPRNRHRRKGD